MDYNSIKERKGTSYFKGFLFSAYPYFEDKIQKNRKERVEQIITAQRRKYGYLFSDIYLIL